MLQIQMNYLYSNASIFHWNYTVAQMLFLFLNKRIIKRTAMKSLEVKYCVVGVGNELQGERQDLHILAKKKKEQAPKTYMC